MGWTFLTGERSAGAAPAARNTCAARAAPSVAYALLRLTLDGGGPDLLALLLGDAVEDVVHLSDDVVLALGEADVNGDLLGEALALLEDDAHELGMRVGHASDVAHVKGDGVAGAREQVRDLVGHGGHGTQVVDALDLVDDGVEQGVLLAQHGGAGEVLMEVAFSYSEPALTIRP